MSEWTDADVEAVAEGMSPYGGRLAARYALASGVVVPARVVEVLRQQLDVTTKANERIARERHEAQIEVSRFRSAVEALADELREHNPGHGDFLTAGKRLAALLTTGRDEDIAAKIERSSLGTPEAQALRATVSDEHAARIVARANELAGQGRDRAGEGAGS